MKPLIVLDKIAENQAGGGACSVDMEILTLKPVTKQQPTARRGVPFKHGGLTRGSSGPIGKIAEKLTEEESSTTQVKGGDSLVDIDTSVSYDN